MLRLSGAKWRFARLLLNVQPLRIGLETCWAEGSSSGMSGAELKSANTNGLLDLVILEGSFRSNILGPQELVDGYTLMGSSFMINMPDTESAN